MYTTLGKKTQQKNPQTNMSFSMCDSRVVLTAVNDRVTQASGLMSEIM